MAQSLQLNIIPFSAPVQEAEFAFYTKRQEGYCPIHKDDLNGAIEGLVDESGYFTHIDPPVSLQTDPLISLQTDPVYT